MNDPWRESNQRSWDDRSRSERENYGQRGGESARYGRDEENEGRSRGYGETRYGTGEDYGYRGGGSSRYQGSGQQSDYPSRGYGQDWRGARENEGDWRLYGARPGYDESRRGAYGAGGRGGQGGEWSRGRYWPGDYGGEADDRYGGDWDRSRSASYRSGSRERGQGWDDWNMRTSPSWDTDFGNRDRSYGGRGDWSRGTTGGYGAYGQQEWRGGRGQGGERDWWERTKDEFRSWMGDEEANRRRQMDEQRARSGRGPRGYTRSDERIKEDVNDRLSEGWLDASDVEVTVVSAEVTLNGTVDSRSAKRRAEDIADSVSGVRHVQNNLRVREDAGLSGMSGTTAGSTLGAGTGTGAGATGTGTGAGTSTTGTGSSTSTSSTRPRH